MQSVHDALLEDASNPASGGSDVFVNLLASVFVDYPAANIDVHAGANDSGGIALIGTGTIT